MVLRSALIPYLITCSIPAYLGAADITGSVVIERKLTRRRVTPAAEIYQRGPSAGLAPVSLDSEESDPLAWERSHVAIYLEGSASPAPPAKPASASITMGQEHRRFVPDFLVVPVGDTVSFPNFDPIFHNVFSLSRPKSFDLGNYPEGQTRKVTFNKPGIVFVNCHLHSNMAAAIVVAPNAWATRAAPSGRFVLPDVPAGVYTVIAWHKSAGFFRQRAVVTPTQGAHIEFEIPLMEPEDDRGSTDLTGH